MSDQKNIVRKLLENKEECIHESEDEVDVVLEPVSRGWPGTAASGYGANKPLPYECRVCGDHIRGKEAAREHVRNHTKADWSKYAMRLKDEYADWRKGPSISNKAFEKDNEEQKAFAYKMRTQ